MTLHKIDREKLAEALEIICARPDNAQEAQNVADDFYEFEMKNDVTPYDFIEQAAENWLAITDPGFEPSEEMKEAGEGYAYGEYIGNAVDGFKAMIATMIKGE